MSQSEQRQRLSRDLIVQEGLNLLEDVGLAELSLRKLAGRLGVSTPTLYWYFANRQDLIDAMAVEVMGRMSQPPWASHGDPVGWRDWLRWLAEAARQAMLAHRDGALLLAMSSPSSRQWADVDRALPLLVRSGFSPPDAVAGIGTVMDFIVGGVLEEQQRDPIAEQAARSAGGQSGLPGGQPHPDSQGRFQLGLALILDGLGTRLA